MATHIFFDFFGTLVSYSPSRREQGYEISHRIVQDAGARLEYEEFLDLWCQVSEEFDARSADTHREFSMVEVGRVFMLRALGQYPPEQTTLRFIDSYIAEWNKGVRYLPGLLEFLSRLSERHKLAVITNTSDAQVVHAHLRQLGVLDLFEAVVTSLEYGFRNRIQEYSNTPWTCWARGPLGASTWETVSRQTTAVLLPSACIPSSLTPTEVVMFRRRPG